MEGGLKVEHPEIGFTRLVVGECAGGAGDFPQEGGFSLVALDQVDIGNSQDRQHQAGEAGAAAEIHQGPRSRRDQGVELGGVNEVPRPEMGQGPGTDQVDDRLPFPQKVGIDLEAVACFT